MKICTAVLFLEAREVTSEFIISCGQQIYNAFEKKLLTFSMRRNAERMKVL